MVVRRFLQRYEFLADKKDFIPIDCVFIILSLG